MYTHDPHHTRHGDRGGPSHFCTPPQLFLIWSLVSPLEAIGNLRENAPTAGKCLYLGCLSHESDQTENLNATYRRVQTLRISLKYCKRVAPDIRGTNFWPKSEILTVLGDAFPHFCRDKREIWYAHPYQISRLSGQRVAPAGQKNPFLDHWVKTIPAWRSNKQSDGNLRKQCLHLPVWTDGDIKNLRGRSIEILIHDAFFLTFLTLHPWNMTLKTNETVGSPTYQV